MPSEAGKKVRTDEAVAEEVLTDRGLRTGVHGAVEVDVMGKKLARHILLSHL